MKASISIFSNKVDIPVAASSPEVPDDLFLAAKRVIENKGCETIRAKDGLYIIKYAENGPFTTKFSDEWLPVHIFKASAWTSGGITQSEMKDFDSKE